jgi:hypothetical protein
MDGGINFGLIKIAITITNLLVFLKRTFLSPKIQNETILRDSID